jgi:hypothetical protein
MLPTPTLDKGQAPEETTNAGKSCSHQRGGHETSLGRQTQKGQKGTLMMGSDRRTMLPVAAVVGKPVRQHHGNSEFQLGEPIERITPEERHRLPVMLGRLDRRASAMERHLVAGGNCRLCTKESALFP